jgi:hypothetical protein
MTSSAGFGVKSKRTACSRVYLAAFKGERNTGGLPAIAGKNLRNGLAGAPVKFFNTNCGHCNSPEIRDWFRTGDARAQQD